MVEIVANPDSRKELARAFGDALYRYLQDRGVGQSEAAQLLGLVDENGDSRRSTLNSYFHDSPKGDRPEPGATVLYLACTKLSGFHFDYGGYRVVAIKLGESKRGKLVPAEQTAFSFHRQFDLAADGGNVDVRVKRPAGRIELFVSVDAKAL